MINCLSVIFGATVLWLVSNLKLNSMSSLFVTFYCLVLFCFSQLQRNSILIVFTVIAKHLLQPLSLSAGNLKVKCHIKWNCCTVFSCAVDCLVVFLLLWQNTLCPILTVGINSARMCSAPQNYDAYSIPAIHAPESNPPRSGFFTCASELRENNKAVAPEGGDGFVIPSH